MKKYYLSIFEKVEESFVFRGGKVVYGDNESDVLSRNELPDELKAIARLEVSECG